MKQKNFKDNKGITLIEILVAIGIFVLIVGSVVAVFLYSWKSNKIIWEQLSTQNQGRSAVGNFVDELRSATYSNTGAYPIEHAGEQVISFYSNIDNDYYRERVSYFLGPDNVLRKGVTKPSGDPLIYNLANEVVTEVAYDVVNGAMPIFYYYNQNFNGISSSTPMAQPVSVTDVRVVNIQLELEEDPTASPVPFHIESKVEVRNLKSN